MSKPRIPVSSWDAVLNITKVQLELTPDPNLYIFFEKDLWGRV